MPLQPSFLTKDERLNEILRVAREIAKSRATILIYGESGTGKELLARYIHQHSTRAARPLVAINCAAVPEGLLESELFGHEKGAFTGAHIARKGKFELAHQSTFLLDEISELSLQLQAKLLRVVQESEVERLGSPRPVWVDFRLIATSNRNLEEMVSKGQFRGDLYYRLHVLPLRIPPLRERADDIVYLTEIFIQKSCQRNSLPLKSVTHAAQSKLVEWLWPGNVRELENVIERSVVYSQKLHLDAEDIRILGITDPNPGHSGNENSFWAPAHQGLFSKSKSLRDAEKELIISTLKITRNNRTQAAKHLGISCRTLRNKLAEYSKEGPLDV